MKRIIIRIGDEILKRSQDLKTLITLEMGRPLFESNIEVRKTLEMVKYFANDGKTHLEGEAIPINSDTFSFTRFMNCGQVCVSPKRIFVEDDIADSFIEGFLNKSKNLVIGNGLDPGTDIGPMVSMEQGEA